MKRIDSVNARPDENGLGKAGFNDNADLPGQDATYVTPGWFNTVQEELCNLLELRGISLNPESKRQLYDLLSTQTDLEALATEIENNFIRKSQIIDNLTTHDAAKPVSAKQAKKLQDEKLDKTALNILDYCPIAYPKSIPPSGYLAMMGQAISQATYPKLYALYGPKLPDLRAYSIRGLDYGRGIDTDRVVLSEQDDAIKSHSHPTWNRYINISTATGSGHFSVTADQTGSTGAVGSTETRVKNIAFLYIVKAG